MFILVPYYGDKTFDYQGILSKQVIYICKREQ